MEILVHSGLSKASNRSIITISVYVALICDSYALYSCFLLVYPLLTISISTLSGYLAWKKKWTKRQPAFQQTFVLVKLSWRRLQCNIFCPFFIHTFPKGSLIIRYHLLFSLIYEASLTPRVKMPVFGVILIRIFPYLARMRENTDQNNSEYGNHFTKCNNQKVNCFL